MGEYNGLKFNIVGIRKVRWGGKNNFMFNNYRVIYIV